MPERHLRFPPPLTTEDVRREALERWPDVEDVSIVAYTARVAGWDKELKEHLAGQWFALFIRREPAGEWEPLCRRRTLRELVEFIRCRKEV